MKAGASGGYVLPEVSARQRRLLAPTPELRQNADVETADFQTSLGIIRVTGSAEAFADDRPGVLAITGAFAKADYMSRLPVAVAPDYAGFVAHLPGNHSPELSEISIDAYAKAFDEVVASLNRPMVVLGISVGGLVALGMKRPAGAVAVEPPLNTGCLWPMLRGIRPYLEQHGPFFWSIFGFSLSGGVTRTYHHLLDQRTVPVAVVVGEEPLFPRRETRWYPSFVTDEDRRILADHPLVELHVAPGAGHDIALQAGPFLLEVLLRFSGSVLQNRPAG